MPVRPIPEGLHNVTPSLVVDGAARAIEFYHRVFGAREIARLVGPGGIVAHAEIRIGDSTIMIADEFPDWGGHGPRAVGGTPVRIHLYVDDVDAVAGRAVSAGAKVLIPVADQFYGDRAGRLEDPFGHVWVIATHRADMTVEEMQRRLDALSNP